MEENKEQKQKPLTEEKFLELLTNHTQEVLLPAMDERFVTKNELQGFKDKTLKGQDKILKKLDTLLTEKDVREYQEKKEKKMWAIIIKALKEHKILSSKELEDIARLEIF